MITLNKTPVTFGNFPNRESNLPLDKLNVLAYNKIQWSYESEVDIVRLAILKDFLDTQGTKSHLVIRYMPHSRMDRTNSSYAMSLKTITTMINNMNFDHVQVVEPHSDVTPALLDRSSTYDWCSAKLPEVLYALPNVHALFYPDAGAAKRYGVPLPMPYATGRKERDFETGEITSFDLSGEVQEEVLIVDDMCSKGGTFVHSAKLLKKNGAKKVYLMINYCENTVFEGELFDHVEKVFISKKNVMRMQHSQLILI